MNDRVLHIVKRCSYTDSQRHSDRQMAWVDPEWYRERGANRDFVEGIARMRQESLARLRRHGEPEPLPPDTEAARLRRMRGVDK